MEVVEYDSITHLEIAKENEFVIRRLIPGVRNRGGFFVAKSILPVEYKLTGIRIF